MRSAIRLHCPTQQQQAEYHAQHQLLLFRQRVHCLSLASLVPPRNCLDAFRLAARRLPLLGCARVYGGYRAFPER